MRPEDKAVVEAQLGDNVVHLDVEVEVQNYSQFLVVEVPHWAHTCAQGACVAISLREVRGVVRHRIQLVLDIKMKCLEEDAEEGKHEDDLGGVEEAQADHLGV